VVQVIDDDPAEVFLPDTVPEDAAERSMLAAATKVEATEHYTDRKFRCALKLYGFGHMLDPTNMVYKLNMAAAYLELEQFAECLECCDEAIAVGDTADAEAKLLGKAHFRRGRALSGLEKFDDAIKAFKMALEKNRCAEYLKAKNECLKAHERYLADREYDPLKAQGCKARGNDLYQKGDFPEAVAEYERAIRHDPKNTGLLSKVYGDFVACPALP
jgi:stress-induced-phosphoprotein 1